MERSSRREREASAPTWSRKSPPEPRSRIWGERGSFRFNPGLSGLPRWYVAMVTRAAKMRGSWEGLLGGQETARALWLSLMMFHVRGLVLVGDWMHCHQSHVTVLLYTDIILRLIDTKALYLYLRNESKTVSCFELCFYLYSLFAPFDTRDRIRLKLSCTP